MKISMILATLILATGAVQAAEPAKKPPSPAQLAQQEKMKACNAEAGSKEYKGDERKKFMSGCLKAKPAEEANQQNKMKTCNADATTKALKGDERKKFMSECLKGEK